MRLQVTIALLLTASMVVACGGESDGDAGPPGPTNNDVNNPPTGNRAPNLHSIGNKRAVLGEQLAFALAADDPDGDALTYSLYGEVPDGAKFDKAAGRFSWTPVATQVGTTSVLTFVVSDGNLDDRETIEIRVTEGGENLPPALANPGDQILEVGVLFELRLQGTDEDGDRLAYSIDGAAPPGATIDAVTGLFRWTPEAAHMGQSFVLRFVVSDGQAQATADVTLFVSDVDFAVADIEPHTVELGTAVEFSLQIHNPDGLAVTCSAQDAPSGSAFEPSTCTFSWTPTDAGLANTAVQVTFRVDAATAAAPISIVKTATISIVPSQVTGPCTADGNEPNDDRSAATAIAADDYTTESSVCEGDEDWYSVDVVAGQPLIIDLTFAHELGDLDVEVFAGADVVALDGGYSSTDNERVVIPSPPRSDTYFINVYDSAPVAGNSYSMRVQTNAAIGCDDDGSEPNSEESAATVIPPAHAATYTICPADADYFAVALDEGVTYRATITFDATDTDFDLEITGPDGYRDTSASITGTEEIVVEGAVAGTYLVKVFGYTSADSGSYDFVSEVTGGDVCTADAAEPNQSMDTATLLTASMDNLTLCGDTDWYRYNAATFELIIATVTTPMAAELSFEVFDSDGQTSLGESVLDGETRALYVGPIDRFGPIYFVVGGGTNVEYQLGLNVTQ